MFTKFQRSISLLDSILTTQQQLIGLLPHFLFVSFITLLPSLSKWFVLQLRREYLKNQLDNPNARYPTRDCVLDIFVVSCIVVPTNVAPKNEKVKTRFHHTHPHNFCSVIMIVHAC